MSHFSSQTFQFTEVELTVRRHDVNFIAQQAKSLLLDRHGPDMGMCTNALPRGSTALFTTKEVSDIVEQIYHDSVYYYTPSRAVAR